MHRKKVIAEKVANEKLNNIIPNVDAFITIFFYLAPNILKIMMTREKNESKWNNRPHTPTHIYTTHTQTHTIYYHHYRGAKAKPILPKICFSHKSNFFFALYKIILSLTAQQQHHSREKKIMKKSVRRKHVCFVFDVCVDRKRGGMAGISE